MEDRSQIPRIAVLLTARELQVLIRASEFLEDALGELARDAGRDVRKSVLRTAHQVLLVAQDRAGARAA